MNKDISIIIPCYNCEKTLEESVNSIYQQDLYFPFEIIMVNDCSTDNTLEVMKNLSDKHPEIKIFNHEKNKGGGATRNTAVSKTSGEVIFCLDSDDILPKGTLSKMLNFLKENQCDAVTIHRSIKFKGTNTADISTIDVSEYIGDKIPFISLFEKITGKFCPVYYVFMFTKKSFLMSGGYPEDHGFDTQGFAWRFLSKNFIVYTCPGAEYLHRVNFHASYYIREYNSGRINYNWQKIMEEFLFIFTKEAQDLILNFNAKNPTKNIYDEIQKLENILVSNPIPNPPSLVLQNNDPYITYWIANEYLKRNDFEKALCYFTKAKTLGLTYGIIKRKIKMCKTALNRNLDYIQVEKYLSEKYLRNINNPISIFFRLIAKIFKNQKYVSKKTK